MIINLPTKSVLQILIGKITYNYAEYILDTSTVIKKCQSNYILKFQDLIFTQNPIFFRSINYMDILKIIF